MTTRSDLPRLGASLGVLGTLLEAKGIEAHDVMQGWEHGPRKAPSAATDEVCRCGHSIESHVDGHDVCTFQCEIDRDMHNITDAEYNPLDDLWSCMCNRFVAAPQGSIAEDRKTEMLQRARAARHFAEWQSELDTIDALTQKLLRRMDIACPPHPAELRNRRTNDLDPVTSADVAAAGWCASCWRNDQQMVPIEKDRHDLRFYRDYCRWCGSFKAQHKIEPPMPLLALRHAGRRITEADVAKAMKDAKPKKRKGKKKAA